MEYQRALRLVHLALGVLLWGLLLSPIANAATFVNRYVDGGGVERSRAVELAGQTTWDLGGSPYVVELDLTVLAGASLQIDPGVVVQVSRKLTVLGTVTANDVTFEPLAGVSWKGIYLGAEAGSSVIENSRILGTGVDQGFYYGQWKKVGLFIDGCSPSIVGNTFRPSDGNGIEVYHSKAVVRGNTFELGDPSRYPVRLNDGNSFLVMSGNQVVGDGVLGIGIPSNITISESGRWTHPGAGLVYLPDGDVTLSADTDLVVDAGVVVQNKAKWTVWGALKIEGNEAAPVRFLGPWTGIYFGDSSGNSELRHVVFQGGGNGDLGFFEGAWRKAAVYLGQSAPVLEDVVIDGSANVGLELYDSSATFLRGAIRNSGSHAVVSRGSTQPRIVHTAIESNQSPDHFVIWSETGSVPLPDNVQFQDNTLEGIQIVAGSLAADRHLVSWGAEVPYVLTGDLAVEDGVTLSIDPGTVVKVDGAKLWVLGTLLADSVADSIVFTSLKDDSVGGDTNADGVESTPEAGAWKGVYLGPNAGASVLRGCEFRYAGQGSLGFLQGVWRQTAVYVDESSPVIDQNVFRDSLGNGLGVHRGEAVVSNNQFIRMGATGYPIAVNSLETFPILSGNETSETPNAGIRILTGNIATEARWRNPGPGLAYLPIGNLQINEGASLRIDAGTQIESVGVWTVLGRLNVEGTEQSPVSMGGNWAGIYFGVSSGESSVSHLRISGVAAKDLGFFHGVWRKSAVYVDSTSPRFDSLQIMNGAVNGIELYASNALLNDLAVQGCGGHAFVALSGSRPTVNGAAFVENGASGHYTVLTDASSVPNVQDIVVNGNLRQGIEVRGGTITADTVWVPWAANAPYVVTGDVTVAADTTLEVAPGSVIKLSGTKLWVEGTLRAQAEPHAIAFTSLADDSIGGDTNGDGDETQAAAGDWIGIYLGHGAGESVLDGVSLRYGGRGELGFLYGSWRRSTLYVDQNGARIQHSWVRDSLGSGLEMYSANPTVLGNRFENMGGDRFPILFQDLNCFPVMVGNEVGGTGHLAVSVPSGDLTRSGTWMKPGPSLPYWPLGDLGIPIGTTLALEPGVEFHLAGSKLNVLGTLAAPGEIDERIRFVGRPGAEGLASWKGIYFGPEAGESVLANSTIAQAGAGDIGFLDGVWRRTSIYIDKSAPGIEQSFVVDGHGEGIHLSGSESIIVNSLVAGHERAGIVSRGAVRPSLKNLTVVNNKGDGVFVQSGAAEITNTLMTHNGARGFNMQSDEHFETHLFRHNLLFGNSADDGVVWLRYQPGGDFSNLDSDPLYLDREAGDYRLAANSPAIDAGTGEPGFAVDLAGRVRWHGQSIDIGAYEQDAPEVSYGVDLAIRPEGEGEWTGEADVSPIVQSIESRVPFGQESAHEIHFEYTGNAFDQIRLFANTPPEGWDARGFLVSGDGLIDISEVLFGEEGYPVLALVQGAEYIFLLQATPTDGEDNQAEWLATVRAQGTKGQFDEVELLLTAGALPEILEHPVGGIVEEGSDARLEVLAEGAGELSYQWRLNGEDIPGAIQSTLPLPAVSVGQAGAYSVVVIGEFGRVESQVASLEVQVPPREELQIVTQPAARTVDEYDEVILGVELKGEGPFSYQWVRDDDPICGETAPQLRFPAIRFHQRAFYSVIVTDSLGHQVASDKVVVDVVASDREELVLFDNQNIGAVVNQPTLSTQFTLTEPTWLSQVETYHWNQAQGKDLGSIGLEDENGVLYGPWDATGRCGQGGVVNAYWSVFPDVELSAGTYTIIDSDPASWAHNGESGGRGFASVKGSMITSVPPVDGTVAEATGLDADWRLSGEALWFAQSAETNGPGMSMQSGAITHNQSSVMELALSGPGTLSFVWKVSSEAADPLRFLVDGLQVNRIASEQDWQEVSLPLRWGDRLLSWVYSKDGSVDRGSDAGWVDNVVYEPVPLFSVEEVLPDTPQPFTLSGTAPWFGQGDVLYEGRPTAQTGNVGANESAELSFNVSGPGWLRFAWKASSENADPLRLLVNEREWARIAGDHDWKVEEHFLRWGQHAIVFQYHKDGSVDALKDAGWLADLSYEPVPLEDLSMALDQPDLVWESDSETPWFGQGQVSLSGGAAAQSGNITAGQSVDMKTRVEGPATLVFRWKASSETPDFGSFLINDRPVSTIRGETEWIPEVFALEEGSHTLTWRYQKDGSVDVGADAVFVDQLELIRGVPTAADLPLEVLPDPGRGIQSYRSSLGRILLFRVTGSADGQLWGTDVYTDDSAVGKAAVHAGLLAVGEEGVVRVTVLPGRDAYQGTARNGVQSNAFGSWAGSFRLDSLVAEPVSPPPVLLIRTLGDGNVEVSWETAMTAWYLETSSSLGIPAWQVVDGVVDLGNGRRGIVLETEALAAFFRLSQ